MVKRSPNRSAAKADSASTHRSTHRPKRGTDPVLKAAGISGWVQPPKSPPLKRGPRTAAGKAASSRNALKHGLRSGIPVIPGVESFEEWEEFKDGIVASYAPEGRLETELAETCANILWRKRRVYNYETEMTAHHLDRIPSDLEDVARYGAALGKPMDDNRVMDWVDEQVDRRSLATKEHMERVIRYESHYHRLWVQTHHELEAFQSRRKGDRPSPLARLDVAASPV
jgi:hypothetical protein